MGPVSDHVAYHLMNMHPDLTVVLLQTHACAMCNASQHSHDAKYSLALEPIVSRRQAHISLRVLTRFHKHTMAPPKRKGFDLQAGNTPTPRQSMTKAPKVEDIQIGPAWHAPPADVVRKMGNGDQWLIGIDIETAGWKVSIGNKGSIGQFGFYNLCAESDFESRVCQLGWVFGAPGQPEVEKEYLVKPDGWVISKEAFDFHKITQAQAEAKGLPLAEILTEFCMHAKAVADRGGRLVCHHMVRDGGTETRRT